MLHKKLKDYSDTVNRNGESIYKTHLKEVLEKSKKIPKPEHFQSNLNVNCAGFLTPLNCSQNGSSCTTSEKFSRDEFQEFYETFQNKTFSTKSNVITHIPNVNNDLQRERKSIKPVDTVNRNVFKTARDELQQQNIKKYGNSNVQQFPSSNAVGQKRKLGTRRNINSKFVSPLLTNNER